ILWFVFSAIFHAPFPPLWKLLLLVLHIMITFWQTGSNRNQQLLRFTSIIAIGTISALLIPVYPYIRLVFSYIVQVVALGFGYAINPLFSAAALKETDDFWPNKGNLKDPTIKDDLEPLPFDPTLINSITIIGCTTIAIYIVWKIIKHRKHLSLPNIPFFEST
ncbi:DUF4018 domain-containing protein, partial [Bacillus cereus]|uniref:DUF4018 domain-containing protein n=1 Tax=Bacillus cereus TaxID=1396 RepID=UPI000BEE7526